MVSVHVYKCGAEGLFYSSLPYGSLGLGLNVVSPYYTLSPGGDRGGRGESRQDGSFKGVTGFLIYTDITRPSLRPLHGLKAPSMLPDIR